MGNFVGWNLPPWSQLPSGTTMAFVDFVVHYFLPVFKYLFIAGLLGAVPVIIITAVKTAESIFEEDDAARDHRNQ